MKNYHIVACLALGFLCGCPDKVERKATRAKRLPAPAKILLPTPIPALILHADRGSLQENDTVCVTIDWDDVRGNPNHVDGGQFFLVYDNAALDFIGMAPGDHTAGTDASGCPEGGSSDFQVEFIQDADEANGEIGYVVGTRGGFTGSTIDQIMATMQFKAITAGQPLVGWDPASPPERFQPPLTNRLSAQGNEVLPLNLIDLHWTGPAPDAFSRRDHVAFAACMSGPGSLPGLPSIPAMECLTRFDVDADFDVDLADWAVASRSFR